MTLRTLISILLLSCGTLYCMAQSQAEQFIDNVIAHFEKAPGITADFTMKGDENSGLHMQGKLMMQGKKFHLATKDLTTWYDGKTMWSYAPAIGEVNITTPTHRELMEINPYLILEDYRNSFIVKELESDVTGERVFRLTPTKRNTPFTHIVVTIDTHHLTPISFVINNNNNNTYVAVTNYKDNVQLQQSTFTFDAAGYPNVTVIDLR